MRCRNGSQAGWDRTCTPFPAGVHLLLIDLFPPGKRDPQGIHGAVVEDEGGFVLPPDKPLTCVAYLAGAGVETFLEPVAVGDPLPDMPLFLSAETYCPVPLEATYQMAWDGMPAYWRDILTGASTSN